MTIDLRRVIREESAISTGGFTGGVFLTYTLNLTFYEQIIAPALDQAGCANVLIIADPDGYAGAMEMGAKSINGVGLRYVCVPLPRSGAGVQHAKVLLMAGPQRGRLLLGSGNLTLHGYGRNLELYSHFEYDAKIDQIEVRYPFQRIWQLISSLDKDGQLSSMASIQLGAIREKAKWLEESSSESDEFQVWKNYNESIWNQLQTWRQNHGLISAIESLFVISPYYDSDAGTLLYISNQLLPAEVNLYISPLSTNLDGEQFLQNWKNQSAPLRLHGVRAMRTEGSKGIRALHAKAIVGREANGVWCITGSANLSRPALMRSWGEGGNLEVVTFIWSTDMGAFDYLLQDPMLEIKRLKVEDITASEEEPSERLTHISNPLLLKEVTLKGKQLSGQVSGLSINAGEEGYLRFLRANQSIPVRLNSNMEFLVELPFELSHAEAVSFEFGENASAYRWIDQPEQLARYGARSFHARIKGKIETFDGSKNLFVELMNFLWDRVDPKKDKGDKEITRSGRRRKSTAQQENTESTPEPPPPEEFITEEQLIDTINWGIEQQSPYDHSILSLRDLLSMVLLRLTTTVELPDSETETGERDEDADQRKTLERETKTIKILDYLRNYLLRYSKRYGKRLADETFVFYIGPNLLFQNHFTLGRVLLEFADKADNFSRNDLAQCFWWIWAPLVWPRIVGFEGMSTMEILYEHYPKEFIKEWYENGLPTLTSLLMLQAFRTPPHWHSGIWLKDTTTTFIVVKELITKLRHFLGNDALKIDEEFTLESYGIESIYELIIPKSEFPSDQLSQIESEISAIINYCPPTKEKFLPIMRYSELIKAGLEDSPESNRVKEQIHEHGLGKQLDWYKERQAPIKDIPEDEEYCPRCFGKLTIQGINRLKRGELVLCTNRRDAWIYQVPTFPNRII